MSKELANYKSTDEVVVVKISPAVYNGKYVSTYKNLGPTVISGSKHAGDLRSSLKKTIESVNHALRESEKIIPLNKNAIRGY
ncbi:hypothetical protein FAY30_26090 (plasmid) [Bacillus sp. S3]|uniref:hypothetical protein n=1 Tax=Bacillus sp. S3 TaxID=486398 RepID=UPI00118887C7|nr:hypothetical protein [Bacillus sp. S3]QCJ45422.1 hypothetical protein FAY30_26090 [Bacillus sp. S3]